jgi:hypothetical protein
VKNSNSVRIRELQIDEDVNSVVISLQTTSMSS